jgi:membrane protein implicated in regulation of membrane protease activity
MLTFYVICLLVGLIFAVLSFIFSGAFEAHVDAGVDVGGDIGGDIGGDMGHDISGGDVGVGEIHFPLFSPIVLAGFVTAFGGGGLIGLKIFPFMPAVSVAFAIGGGLAVGFLAGLVVKGIYKHLQSNSVTRMKTLIGREAEVTEAIPASGVGEISLMGEGSRISGPARCEENKDVKRHAMVTITRIVGGLYYVREHVDEKLRDISLEGKGSGPTVSAPGDQDSNQGE